MQIFAIHGPGSKLKNLDASIPIFLIRLSNYTINTNRNNIEVLYYLEERHADP